MGESAPVRQAGVKHIRGGAMCFDCGLPIRWIRIGETREATACERRPSSLNGSIELLADGTGRRLGGVELRRARDSGDELYAPHFCPGRRRPDPDRRSVQPFQLRLKPEATPNPRRS